MSQVLMVQGTMSNAGKSLLVAGLCRVFRQDGYRVAPFKSQNMALNSYVTKDGLEMGRAQAMQAEAAGIEPSVFMNPILLKPTDDIGSQVIVNGKVLGNMKAREYFAFKKSLVPDILAAFHKLEEEADIIVIEGAGSPAEINLKDNDIVNMGMAEMVDAPVLLVGDIDRGGVFAQLLGTLQLLEEEELARIEGLVINKFRGDKTILDPGIEILEEKGKVPVVGVLPYLPLKLEDEDSLSERFYQKEAAIIDIAVIHLPHISNFSDFDTFEQMQEVSVRYVTSPLDYGNPDLVILPGSKSTIADLAFLRECGLEDCILQSAQRKIPIIGICGGYQMLGLCIEDPLHVESSAELAEYASVTGSASPDFIEGLGLLPVETYLSGEKQTKQFEGKILDAEGIFAGLKGLPVKGYEIHMGHTGVVSDRIGNRSGSENTQTSLPFTSGNTGFCRGEIYGTYVHGFFDDKEVAQEILRSLAEKKGFHLDFSQMLDYAELKEKEFDKLADMIRTYMDMEAVYAMLREAK